MNHVPYEVPYDLHLYSRLRCGCVAKGYEQPESWVPPGFEQVTAAVFEVPADAQNFVLVWEKAGIKVSLN